MEAWALRSLMRVGTHIYLFPLYSQARSVIWQGMDFDGLPFLSAIPGGLIENKNESRMEIQIRNGSRLILAGSNKYDSLMGTNPVTIIYSEAALHHPLAREYLSPIIIQNQGREILQSTPRGKNHFYDTFMEVQTDPEFHVEYLTSYTAVDNNGNRIISDAYLEKAKSKMSEERIRQEFLCDFDVGNVGAYFTREISDMEAEGRITDIKVDPSLPIHTVWDLGGTDATAGWLYQIVGNYIHLLMFFQDSGKGLRHYLEAAERYRQSVGGYWGTHWMPHDIHHKHQGWEQAESRMNIARQHGWMFQTTPKVNFEDGIESLRFVLDRIRIDRNNCSMGIRALREYQRKYDEVLCRYTNKPVDNWAVHTVDALRYLAVNYRRLFDLPLMPMKYGTTL